MKQEDIILDVQNLKKYFPVARGKNLHAIDDVSFQIKRGETLGLVGESGCGKTTIGRTIVGLYDTTEGDIIFNGKSIARMSARQRRKENLASKMQMIYQDPYASLNPCFTVGEIIGEGLEIHNIGHNKSERHDIVCELLERVGLSKEHSNRFPHEFSGGQRQRVGIARSLALNPEFIVCDEATSALDVSVQAQVVNMLIDLKAERNLTYLVVAHDLSVVRYISDRVAVMYLGQLMEVGSVNEVYDHPVHPYTIGLLDAVPVADPDYERGRVTSMLQGEVFSPINPRAGCRFAPRCPYATEKCSTETPVQQCVGTDHYVKCHHPLI